MEEPKEEQLHKEQPSPSGKKKHPILRGILVGVILLIVLAAAGLFVLFRHYYDQTNYLRDADVPQVPEEELPEEIRNDLGTDLSPQEQEEELEKAQAAQEDVFNILLIGSDRRDTSWYGNSDVMMLVSINKRTEQIHLVSFMRDSYAVVGDRGGHKLNYAYAVGGGPLLVETIEENYRLHIDQYASADFTNTAEIVDLLGGVDVELNSAEARQLARGSYGADAAEIDGAGTYHLNGAQAVGYARIRNIGNSDYRRTERQRTVMTALFQQARQMSLSQLNSLAEEILPLLTHNMSQGTVLTLLADLPEILSYELVTDRVPYDGLYYFRGEMLVPEWEETIERLQEELYGTEEQPSR